MREVTTRFTEFIPAVGGGTLHPPEEGRMGVSAIASNLKPGTVRLHVWREYTEEGDSVSVFWSGTPDDARTLARFLETSADAVEKP